MPMVDIVIGDKVDRKRKWVETIEAPSRKVAAEEGKKIVEKWNNTLRPDDTARVFWCVVPERPSTPKKKKEVVNVPIPTSTESPV